MATVSDLKAVLKDTLEKRGVLGHLKARIRAEVFNALDDENEPRPTLSHENLLINELIREYLEFNKYKYTASVLIAESGQPVVPLDRQFLIRELNAFEESKDNTIPLLYGILAHFLHGIKDGIQNAFLKGSSLQPQNPNLGRQPCGRKQMVPETSESQVPVNEALGAYSVESSVEDSEMRMTAEPAEEQ